MIISLPDTTTRQIAGALLKAQENFSMATGRVLTLLVAAPETEDSEAILETVRAATRENPARVIVLLLGDASAPTSMNADLIIAAHSGASEMVVMRLFGELTGHLDAVVTPLLLPDTPIVAWWPGRAPAKPVASQLGAIAQRRITNARADDSPAPLRTLVEGYHPGDSDMAWSRITPWRGVVASALDRYADDPVQSVSIAGDPADPAVLLAAGWLAACLDVEVTRSPIAQPRKGVPVEHLALHCEKGDITVDVLDAHTARVAVPGSPASHVALGARSDASCLAEELRHLDDDVTYARALQATTLVREADTAPAHVVDVVRVADRPALVDAAADRLLALLAAIQADAAGGLHGDGIPRVVLTGGTAGIELLAKLAERAESSDVDVARIEFFFGDERNVPATHPDSNEGQAREALLDPLSVPAERIHGWGLDGGEMDEAVAAYERALDEYAPRGFDLHLLGMGGEGHINSLFPDTDAVRESRARAFAVTDSPKPPAERATLTLPAVRSAERVWLLVSGAEKAEAAGHVARGASPEDWPAAGARGSHETVLFVSEDAAGAL